MSVMCVHAVCLRKWLTAKLNGVLNSLEADIPDGLLFMSLRLQHGLKRKGLNVLLNMLIDSNCFVFNPRYCLYTSPVSQNHSNPVKSAETENAQIVTNQLKRLNHDLVGALFCAGYKAIFYERTLCVCLFS